MKLAYTVCTPDTKGKYPAYRDNLKEMLFALKEIGYQGVEPFVRDPRAIDQDEFCRLLESTGLEVAAIGTGPLVSEDNLTFTSTNERVRIEAIERSKAVIDFASTFGAQVNIGKLRGDIHKHDPLQALEWQKQAFIQLSEYATTKRVAITIEPQCRFAVDNLNNTQEALALVKELQLPNLFVMLDVFHMHIEERSQAASFIDAKAYNMHVHFADNNRGIPGTGQIDFADTIRILKALGYRRYISIEISQFPDCYSAAKRSFEYVTHLILEA